jgi:hypothetical protein
MTDIVYPNILAYIRWVGILWVEQVIFSVKFIRIPHPSRNIMDASKISSLLQYPIQLSKHPHAKW